MVDMDDCMGEVLRISRWSIYGMLSELIDKAGVVLAGSHLKVTLFPVRQMDIVL